jgi:hypothetical protein
VDRLDTSDRGGKKTKESLSVQFSSFPELKVATYKPKGRHVHLLVALAFETDALAGMTGR